MQKNGRDMETNWCHTKWTNNLSQSSYIFTLYIFVQFGTPLSAAFVGDPTTAYQERIVLYINIYIFINYIYILNIPTYIMLARCWSLTLCATDDT